MIGSVKLNDTNKNDLFVNVISSQIRIDRVHRFLSYFSPNNSKISRNLQTSYNVRCLTSYNVNRLIVRFIDPRIVPRSLLKANYPLRNLVLRRHRILLNLPLVRELFLEWTGKNQQIIFTGNFLRRFTMSPEYFSTELERVKKGFPDLAYELSGTGHTRWNRTICFRVSLEILKTVKNIYRYGFQYFYVFF